MKSYYSRANEFWNSGRKWTRSFNHGRWRKLENNHKYMRNKSKPISMILAYKT